MINILVISNEQTHLELLSHYSDFQTTLVAADQLETIIEHCQRLAIDIVLITDAPANMSQDMLCYELSSVVPNAQNLILIDESPTFDMLQNSGFKARGYVTLEQWNSLPKAIRAVHSGEAWLPRRLVAEMLNRFLVNHHFRTPHR